MRKVVWVILLLPAVAMAVGVWREIALELPSNYLTVYAVAVNNNRVGYAFAGDGYSPGACLTLELKNGNWSPLIAAPKHLIYPSVAPDGALYAVDDRGSGEVYRLYNAVWKIVAIPAKFGLDTFTGVAAVSAREFWATGATTAGNCVVVHFVDEEAVMVYNLGPLNAASSPSNLKIVIPRVSSPSSDCYVAVHAGGNPYGSARWLLFVLEGDGSFRGYPLPRENYYCDGLASYLPGEVRVMQSILNGDSVLYRFANGVFTEVISFPERVRLESYSTPNDGWGIHSPSKIYHWTGGAVAPAVDLGADVTDLDMFDAHNGWAVGSVVRVARVPMIWQYKDEQPSLTPTSLGRVKAAFR